MRTPHTRRHGGSLTLASGPARGTAATGSSFTLLLLLSAGTAAVPAGSDPVERVRDFYVGHAGAVVVAQLVALLAAGFFALFARWLAATSGSPARRLRVRRSGEAVAVVAALTSVPVLWLCAAAHAGSSSLIHRLADGFAALPLSSLQLRARGRSCLVSAQRLWSSWGPGVPRHGERIVGRIGS